MNKVTSDNSLDGALGRLSADWEIRVWVSKSESKKDE